jgi:aconitase A
LYGNKFIPHRERLPRLVAHAPAATRPHAPQDHNARENRVEHGMSMIHQRPIDILTGTFGTVRHIDVRTAAGGDLSRMPLCHRVLLENVLRQPDADVAEAGRRALLDWLDPGRSEAEIPFAPSRILMHDTTCGPALVDIAAMRDALAEAGGDPARLNPACPVATSTDHSVGAMAETG